MGRMHSNGKGISKSALPYSRRPPSWLKTSPEEVVQQIVKFARKGVTPSQIGANLRDSHGIAQIRYVTGNKIIRILKAEGLAPEIPEDLYHLIVSTYQEGRLVLTLYRSVLSPCASTLSATARTWTPSSVSFSLSRVSTA